MTAVPERFPKVRSVYSRSNNDNGDYTVDPVVNTGFDWVFERSDEVQAVEKIHGTNVGILKEDGTVTEATTRIGDRSMNYVEPYDDVDTHYVVRGIQNSIRRGYTDDMDDGWIFGELVGPKLHGNPYDLDEHLFIPFEWLRDKCEYRSYGKYPTDFDSVSGWLEEDIFSLFYSKMNGTDLDEASVSNGTFVEGLVFIHPDFEGRVHPDDLHVTPSEEYGSVTHTLGKLRRDMYEWWYEK